MKAIAFAALCSLLFSPVSHAETSTLTMRFVIDTDSLAANASKKSTAATGGDFTTTDESFTPDAASNGLENFLVYVYTGRGGTRQNLPRRNPESRTLRIEDTTLDPLVVTAQVGDSLNLVNRGKQQLVFLNGFNFPPRKFWLQPAETRQIPLGPPAAQALLIELTQPEAIAYVFLFDHPFATVADEDGVLSIAGLPSNVDLTFRAWHPKLRIKHVEIDGVPTIWRRSCFELNLQPGVNELGDVVIPVDSSL